MLDFVVFGVGRRGGTSLLLRSIPTTDVDISFALIVADADLPRPAAHLAILDERAEHIRLEIELHLLATIRAKHYEF